MIVRSLLRADLAPLRRLFTDAFQEEYQQRGLDVVSQLSRWEGAYPLARLLSVFPNPYQHVLNFFIAEEGGELAGFVLIVPGNRQRTRWHIDYIAVAPAFRGRGIGKLLLDHVFARYTACGATTFTLEVDTRNAAALGLYARSGFHRYATVNYYKLDAEALLQLPAPTGAIAGLRPYRASDAEALYGLYNACTPAPVRLIDTRTPDDFRLGPVEWASQQARARMGQCLERRLVVEGPDRTLLGYLRLVGQLRPLPHSLHAMVHPGHEALWEPLIRHGFARLAAIRPGMALSWAPDYQPARRAVLEGLGMQLITADHSLARTTLATLPMPAVPPPKVEDQAFKPAFSVETR